MVLSNVESKIGNVAVRFSYFLCYAQRNLRLYHSLRQRKGVYPADFASRKIARARMQHCCIRHVVCDRVSTSHYFLSNVESKVGNVAVLHDIIFALKADKSLVAGGGD